MSPTFCAPPASNGWSTSSRIKTWTCRPTLPERSKAYASSLRGGSTFGSSKGFRYLRHVGLTTQSLTHPLSSSPLNRLSVLVPLPHKILWCEPCLRLCRASCRCLAAAIPASSPGRPGRCTTCPRTRTRSASYGGVQTGGGERSIQG